MSDPPFRFDLPPTAEIEAALKRGDYGWLCENVFTPALVQFLDQKHTDALVKGSTFPRSRRPAATRRHRNHRTRRSHQVPG